MCDEITERELEDYLNRKALTRRGFTGGASAAMVAGGFTACAASETDTSAPVATESQKAETPAVPRVTVAESTVSVPTPDGTVDGIFVHPIEGTTAAVVMWPDIHGVRPAFFDMARRLAASGYAVLAVNPYYRTHEGRLFADGQSIRSPGGRDLVIPHRSALSVETVSVDAEALVKWLDAQSVVDTKRKIGAIGFCMTGSWTIRAAAALPARIGAPCSFHGGQLVTDAEDSPHKLAGKIQGGALIAIAENDHERSPDDQDALIKAFADAGVPAEIEVYDDAMHGWVPTDSRAYNPEQSERAWNRMLALFERELS